MSLETCSRHRPNYHNGSVEIQQPQLPTELLSLIVAQALISPRLTNKTDQLYIQPKCKIAFESLSNGFGRACRKYRAILFREWFRALNVYELDDLQEAGSGRGNIISTVRITGFISNCDYIVPSSVPMDAAGDDNDGASNSWGTRPHLRAFPKTLQRIELREAQTCSPEELSSTGISRFTDLRSLRVSCGDKGAWGPVLTGSTSTNAPDQNQNSGPTSAQTPSQRQARSQGQSLLNLAHRYISILSPINRLAHLSLDIHLSDNGRFAEGHQQSDVIGAGVALPPPNPFHWNNFPNPFNINAFNNTNIGPVANNGNANGNGNTAGCTLDNFCAQCWDVRRSGSQARESMMTKLLAKGLKRLKVVEWTIWFREKGKGEERRRIEIERSGLAHLGCQPSAFPVVPLEIGPGVNYGRPSSDPSHSTILISASIETSISSTESGVNVTAASTPPLATHVTHWTQLDSATQPNPPDQPIQLPLSPIPNGGFNMVNSSTTAITIQGGGDEDAINALPEVNERGGERSEEGENNGTNEQETEGIRVDDAASPVDHSPDVVDDVEGDGENDEDAGEQPEEDDDQIQTTLTTGGDFDGIGSLERADDPEELDAIEAIKAIEDQFVDDSDEEIYCISCRVPYAMYPAVLG